MKSNHVYFSNRFSVFNTLDALCIVVIQTYCRSSQTHDVFPVSNDINPWLNLFPARLGVCVRHYKRICMCVSVRVCLCMSQCLPSYFPSRHIHKMPAWFCQILIHCDSVSVVAENSDSDTRCKLSQSEMESSSSFTSVKITSCVASLAGRYFPSQPITSPFLVLPLALDTFFF